MNKLTVIYDACVLYPAPLRSLLMYLAMTDLYRARWTHLIHEEWMRNVRKDHSDITEAKVQRIRELMDAHVLDCLAVDFEELIPRLKLPDPDDRHVLAAAIKANANIIVTTNLKDFPRKTLAEYGIEAKHPDDFILTHLKHAPAAVCIAIKRQRTSLKNPPMSVEEFLATLARQNLVKTVKALHEHTAAI